jgi:hypothetical protein
MAKTTDTENYLRSLINASTADTSKKSEILTAGKAVKTAFAKAKEEAKTLTADEIDNICLDVFSGEVWKVLKG